MPRAPDIPDFAAKLGILLDRLNWSRGQVAQRVGVDKSVAQRWVGGQVQPGEASLVALTAAVAQALPEFGRADWRLPLPRFAERFAPAQAVPALSPLAALFPRSVAAGPSPEAAATRYGGLWLLLHASVHVPDRPSVVGYLASIVPRGNALWVEAEGSLQGTWRAAGPALPLHRLLYLMLEDQVQGDSLAFAVLTGVTEGRAMVLDGIGSSAGSSLRGPAVATRMLAIRLDEAPDPPWRAEALRRLVRHNARGIAGQMPEPLAARFRLAHAEAPRAMVLAVPAEASLACDAEEIAQDLAPESATALDFARRLCGL